MTFKRWWAVLVCVGSVAPVLAQTGTVIAQAEPRAAAIASTAQQGGGPDVVVTGRTEKPSDWKRAEADHVVVIGRMDAAELTRVAGDLERLHALMTRLYRRGQDDATIKLQVMLIGSAMRFKAMRLADLRSQEGPFAAAFAETGYYDPRDDGELIVVPHEDRPVALDTNLATARDCEDKMAEGGDCDEPPEHGDGFPPPTDIPPTVRRWQTVLRSLFAQHFILANVPAAYPRWYLDGIGALFSTFEMRRNGAIDYAGAPNDRAQVFRSYGDLKVADILTGRYLDVAPGKISWTPDHAWLLAHYFLFSALTPQRSEQFAQYMTAIHQGTPMPEAALAFGDLRKLQREITAYAAKPVSYARTEPSRTLPKDPLVTPLSQSAAALIELRIEMDGRLATPATATLEAWLGQVREVAARRYDRETAEFAAEAECRSGHPAECLAAADRVLAASPDDVTALTWKGVAMTDRAVTGPAEAREDMLAAARKAIRQAIELDGQALPPLIAWFQSFAKAGESVPDAALRGMAIVVRSNPAAPGPRLYLARELMRQGKADMARRVLYPVLYGPYQSAERKAAQQLVVGSGATQGAPVG